MEHCTSQHDEPRSASPSVCATGTAQTTDAMPEKMANDHQVKVRIPHIYIVHTPDLRLRAHKLN